MGRSVACIRCTTHVDEKLPQALLIKSIDKNIEKPNIGLDLVARKAVV